jgi:hypothetical protein
MIPLLIKGGDAFSAWQVKFLLPGYYFGHGSEADDCH